MWQTANSFVRCLVTQYFTMWRKKVLRAYKLHYNTGMIITFSFTQKIILAKQRHYTHWQILVWNVSKSWLQKVDFFEKYDIVAMQIDNAKFYASKIIKVTSGFDFKKTFFPPGGTTIQKNSWNIFQIQITPLFWHPQGPQGCLEKQNCPLSSNLVVWCAKIGLKS